MPYLLVVAGFVFLIKGANYLIDGAIAIARRLRVSDLVVGLTIIAFGTTMPELFVNLLAAWDGQTDIAIGNILGSSIINILFILGLSAIIYPLHVRKDVIWKDIPLSLLAVLVLGLLANDVLIDGQSASVLSRIDGLIFLAFFTIFIFHIKSMAKASRAKFPLHKKQKILHPLAAFGLLLLGMAALVIGGKLAISGAVQLASAWGVSQSIIGLTVVAIGTSLPELITAATAAFRHKADIAVGNIVGANVLNIFWILGLSALVRPLPFPYFDNFSIIILSLASIMLFLLMLCGRKHYLERWQGVIFVSCYVVYLVTVIVRA